jgi:hypothetical protein
MFVIDHRRIGWKKSIVNVHDLNLIGVDLWRCIWEKNISIAFNEPLIANNNNLRIMTVLA